MKKPYPLVDDLLSPVLRVAMPRPARLYAPGGTVHVVTRCNNRGRDEGQVELPPI